MSRLERGGFPVDFASEPVPYAALLPPGYDDGGPYPLVLALHGGGSSREELASVQPLFDAMWADGLPPMVVAMASTGPLSFYLDHPDGSTRWETALSRDFLAHLGVSLNVRQDATAVAGISMGGMGSLKIAFRDPDRFVAVAAMQPMMEPVLAANQGRPRNQLHYQVGGPEVLFAADRDPELFEANNPATLLARNVDAIRASGLAIYLEAGDDDTLHVHDGAEFLHRLLWDRDIAHEYHLWRGADHGGASMVPRIEQMYRWLGRVFGGSPERSPDLVALRDQLVPARRAAAERDPTVARRYGVLPDT